MNISRNNSLKHYGSLRRNLTAGNGGTVDFLDFTFNDSFTN